MVKWLDVVKSTMEKNKGKPLKEVLPIAKIEWQKLKKSGQVVASTVSNISKKIKGGRKKSSRSNSNVDLSIQETHSAAPIMAQMAMPMGRARGKSRGKTRAGKGKRKGGKTNGRNKTRRIAGKSRKHKKSKSYDITSINLK